MHVVYTCTMDEPWNNYQDAFNEMQSLTEQNLHFKLKFTKADGSLNVVGRCLLRKQTPKAKDSMSEFKLNYIDKSDNTYGTCYIPLILEINDRKIVIQ